MKSFKKNEKGATAIEYGLLISVIALGIMASLTDLSSSIQSTFSKAGSEMTLSQDP